MLGDLVFKLDVELDETIHSYCNAATFDDHDLNPSILVAQRAVERDIPRRVQKRDLRIPGNISRLLESRAPQAS